MLGAVIGDIVGSRFEWDNHRSKNFEFFHDECFFTDDTIMSLAVAKAILECNGSYADLPLEYVPKAHKQHSISALQNQV